MKNGCHNRGPLSASYVVQTGWNTVEGFHVITRAPKYERIENVLSKDCRYSILTPNDPACTGCTRHASVIGGNGDASPAAPRGAHGPNGTPDDTSPHPE